MRKGRVRDDVCALAAWAASGGLSAAVGMVSCVRINSWSGVRNVVAGETLRSRCRPITIVQVYKYASAQNSCRGEHDMSSIRRRSSPCRVCIGALPEAHWRYAHRPGFTGSGNMQPTHGYTRCLQEEKRAHGVSCPSEKNKVSKNRKQRQIGNYCCARAKGSHTRLQDVALNFTEKP